MPATPITTPIDVLSATPTLADLEAASARAASAPPLPTRTGTGTPNPPLAPDARPDPAAAATLAATLGLLPGFAAPQSTQVAQLTPVTPPRDDAPVSALLAAAVGRALGAFHKPAAPTVDAAPDPTAVAAPAGLPTQLTMTPLEQAVHDLIGQIAERDTAHIHAGKPVRDDGGAELAPFHMLASAHIASAPADPSAPAATTAPRAAAPITIPDPPANPSHVHLVLDDGPERTVVTVAVRGNDVHVALRSTDDATSNALTRNAASLDHAMRARGLALGELTAEREPSDRRPPRDPRERREPHDAKPSTEPFKLEETP